jgi:hypothetical protein
MNIEQIVVNGTEWNYAGSIDIGLIDTMQDLFVNFIVLPCLLFRHVLVKDSDKAKIAERFLSLTPKKRAPQDPPIRDTRQGGRPTRTVPLTEYIRGHPTRTSDKGTVHLSYSDR